MRSENVKLKKNNQEIWIEIGGNANSTEEGKGSWLRDKTMEFD
jgi:hypothetical protein